MADSHMVTETGGYWFVLVLVMVLVLFLRGEWEYRWADSAIELKSG